MCGVAVTNNEVKEERFECLWGNNWLCLRKAHVLVTVEGLCCITREDMGGGGAA